MNRIAVLVVASVLFPAASWAGSSPTEREVNIVVDMTPAGRQLRHPTQDQPAYYLPIIEGYEQSGPPVDGAKAPPATPLVHLVAEELAKQGYRSCLQPIPATKDHPAHMGLGRNPDLILVVKWGAMNPQIEESEVDPDDPNVHQFVNQQQMLSLVGGHAVKNYDFDFQREGVNRAAQENRYFVMVSAYDAEAYGKTKKRVVLWEAKMSVPSWGIPSADAMAALIKVGGPLLGRETMRPQTLLAPLAPVGHVEVGTPTVKAYLDTPAAQSNPAPSR